MIERLSIISKIIYLFFALGPLGNLLTPQCFPASFRTYYFILPLFPLFYFSIREQMAKVGVFLLPFLIYCFLSANIVNLFGETYEPHTIFRFFLLFCQFFFVLGAAAHVEEIYRNNLKNRKYAKEAPRFSSKFRGVKSAKLKELERAGGTKSDDCSTPEQTDSSGCFGITPLLKTYLRFFFISLGVGYLLFFGYYLNLFSLTSIEKFTVLTQFGFGFLRFSPGSYPNEYGIVASFVLSLLALIFLDKKMDEFNLSKTKITTLFFFTFIAFLFTTTRAAYLSFFVSLFYISWKSGKFLKSTLLFSLFIFIAFLSLYFAKFNMLQVIKTGFSQRLNEGSLGERISMWLGYIDKEYSFWGTGFASLTSMHNVYLQLLFELGIFGSIFFILSLGLTILTSPKTTSSPFITKVQTIGFINVLSFAASNHNLNHHLTWLVLFIYFAAKNHFKEPKSLADHYK